MAYEEIANMTAAELRSAAAAKDAAKEESFQRCDTDGFLSQWAHGITAELYREQAKIAENGGKAVFKGLYQGDRRVKAKEVSRPVFNAPWRSEIVWYIHKSDPVASIVVKTPNGEKTYHYVPVSYTGKSRVQKALGLTERNEKAPAIAKIMGSGTGLSGAANAYVGVVRTGDEYGADAELVEG